MTSEQINATKGKIAVAMQAVGEALPDATRLLSEKVDASGLTRRQFELGAREGNDGFDALLVLGYLSQATAALGAADAKLDAELDRVIVAMKQAG